MDTVVVSLARTPPRCVAPRPLASHISKHKINWKRSQLIKRAVGCAVGIGGGSGALPFDPLHLVAHAGWPATVLSFLGQRPKQKRKKKILIMYSNTGGGHKASAEALESGFYEAYKDKYEVTVVDLWLDHSPYPVNKLPMTYSFLVGDIPSQGRDVRVEWLHRPYLSVMRFICYARVNEAFELYKPDLVVSVHPLLQHVPIKILQDRIRAGIQRPISFATVITDYATCHNTWFHRGVTQCFVPTKECYNIGLKQGLRPEQLTLHGLPIRPEFAKPTAGKSVLRKKLNMHPDDPAVMLAAGGEGMGILEQTINAIVRHNATPLQLVVICGRNKSLALRLNQRKFPEGMHVIVQGFVHNMNEWMRACDAIVTKAGPGTISEALICGTPILINGYIPGQESGNIAYVTENHVGAYESNPDKIAKLLNEWFVVKRDELKEMSIKAKTLGRPDALFHIVNDLAALCEQPAFAPSYSGEAQAAMA